MSEQAPPSDDHDRRRPNPLPHAKIEHPDGADVRHLDCVSYNSCLEVAVASGWKGFSCLSCAAHVPMGKEDLRSDIEGLAAMLYARGTLMRRWPDLGDDE